LGVNIRGIPTSISPALVVYIYLSIRGSYVYFEIKKEGGLSLNLPK
jgi:hypothetical protein